MHISFHNNYFPSNTVHFQSKFAGISNKMHVKFDKISDQKNVKSALSSTTNRPTSLEKDCNLNGHFTSSCTPGRKVTREPLITPLRWADHKLWRKDGSESTVGEVIANNAITLLLFGSPCYYECREMAHALRDMEYAPEVVYVPVYTYRELPHRVEQDFRDNHGDWWRMGFQSLGAVEATYMCGVTVLPSLVVVNCRGEVVSSYGQLDLAKWGEGSVIAWS